MIRARKVSIHRFAEWQNRPAAVPPRSLARLLKMLPRHWRGRPQSRKAIPGVQPVEGFWLQVRRPVLARL